MKTKKKYVILGSVLVIGAIVLGSTLAWFTWSTSNEQNTNVVVTVGGATISYEDGEDITNNNLIPTSTKEQGISKDITISSTSTVYLDLNMTVVTLDDGLKDASFKYGLYDDTDSPVVEGNFASDNANDVINLLDDVTITNTPTTYTLYIWIDGNMSNPNTMYNQNFEFRLNANATDEMQIQTITGVELTEQIASEVNEGTPNFGSTATTNEGVYAAQDDYGTSYYYRGAVDNNYVYFAGYYWRIVRVNGDGTIRLIYDGTSAHANGESSSDRQIGESAFNGSYNDNAYVGYMYGSTGASSYSATHANTNSSTIKTTVDNWYKTNIVDAGYSDKVADVIYCNDRQIDNLSGYGTALGYGRNQTAYMARYRLYTNKSPVLTCTNKNDRFTVSDTSRGNGALTYPVGLITADEMSMGGAVYGRNNSSYYLYTGQFYWAMSPCNFNSGYAYEFFVNSSGVISYSGVISGYGVRPVLSLESDISVTGSGTQSDPWVVQ